jgi:hypothetical protein
VVGFIKGKSAIHLARVYGERKRSFVGQHFWARGYFVSTVGRDETVIRSLHPTAGAGRQTAGSVEPGNLRRPPAGGQNRRGRVSVLAAALSGSRRYRTATATRGRFARPNN